MNTPHARAPHSATDPAASLRQLRADLAALIPQLRAYARFLAKDRTHADDLVQDTLVRALGVLARFEPGGSLRAWLFTIQRNVFYEQARRRRVERLVMAQAIAPGEPTQAAHQHGEADVADLQRMLWKLAPLLREALVLVGAQGMSYEEAALVCAVPVGTMKARVSRARTQLAKEMGEGPLPGTAEQAIL